MEKYQLEKQDIYRGDLILVNEDYLIRSFIPVDQLESFNQEFSSILFHKKANQFLQAVLLEIGAGNQIVPVSGYRSLEEQEEIFSTSMKENGEEFTLKYVAYPNASEHQTGLAIDLGLNEGEIDFIRPSFPHHGICNEFRKKAIQYGFIERYQEDKRNLTKISAEEWHFRYVGYPHSKIMEENDFCLEEYHEYLKEFQNHPLIYKEYEIQYIPFEEQKKIELSSHDQISGNNMDGFIITRKVL